MFSSEKILFKKLTIMAARTHLQSLAETYEGWMIPRKSSKSSMGIWFVIVATIIVIIIAALITFALHYITVLREDLNSMGVQVDHMKSQLEAVLHRLETIENAELSVNQTFIDDSSGRAVVDPTSRPSDSAPPAVRVPLPAQSPRGFLKEGKVGLPESQLDEVATARRDWLDRRMIGINESFSQIEDSLKDHNRVLKILSKRKRGLIVFCDLTKYSYAL